MTVLTAKNRRFLFLQGPHGPFFDQLAAQLRKAGGTVWRVGFNRGDQAFWSDKTSYIAHREGDWTAHLNAVITEHGITDLVLYGEARAIHSGAAAIGRTRGLRLHFFEEGYLRPYWVTYEREGANGSSRLMGLSVDDMRALLGGARSEPVDGPPNWGDMRHHIFYGALYHAYLLAGNRGYPGFVPHRALSVGTEFRVHLRRLLGMPFRSVARMLASRRIRMGGFPYHLALLQLEHDASFQHHSPFDSITDFVALVIDRFADGAPAHHHLVFKAHPLEDGRAPITRKIAEQARARGVADRVHFVAGGKLAYLLDNATTAVTVNSTAAQQALRRGLPVRAFGSAVYDKPEFVSHQPLDAFFAAPKQPDGQAYRDYRQFLMLTSQVPGGYYSAAARRRLLRRVVDLMLDPSSPYDRLPGAVAAAEQQKYVVQ